MSWDLEDEKLVLATRELLPKLRNSIAQLSCDRELIGVAMVMQTAADLLNVFKNRVTHENERA
jgi:hypothetical protein